MISSFDRDGPPYAIVDDHVAKTTELTRFKCNQIMNYYKFYTSSRVESLKTAQIT